VIVATYDTDGTDIDLGVVRDGDIGREAEIAIDIGADMKRMKGGRTEAGVQERDGIGDTEAEAQKDGSQIKSVNHAEKLAKDQADTMMEIEEVGDEITERLRGFLNY